MTTMLKIFQNSNFSEALAWTLVHSLWQGGIIALVLGFALAGLYRKSADVRYLTSVTAFFGIFAAAGITFFTLFELQNGVLAPQNPAAPIFVFAQIEEISQDKISAFSEYFAAHLPALLTFWYVGVSFLLLRFLTAYAYTKRIKNYRTSLCELSVRNLADRIAYDLGLESRMSVLESPLIDMPMVIGAVKPVILLPLGIVNGLSTREIENILAHEIAHIKRHDYLVNLVQSLGEILLFFNPFVWWISKVIRQERENCCDDLAVSYTGDSLGYAKSLAAVEEMRQVRLAVAFGGQKNTLLNRVKRIIENPRREASFTDGILTAFFMTGLILLVSFSAEARLDLSKTDKIVEKILSVKNKIEESISEEKPENFGEKAKPQKAKETVKNGKFTTKFDKIALKNDTVLFGNDYKIITDKNGKISLYHKEKLLTPEEYAAHQEAFSYKKHIPKTRKMIYGWENEKPDTIFIPESPDENFDFNFKFDENAFNFDKKNFNFDFKIPKIDIETEIENGEQLRITADKLVWEQGNLMKNADSLQRQHEQILFEIQGKKGKFTMFFDNEEKEFNIEKFEKRNRKPGFYFYTKNKDGKQIQISEIRTEGDEKAEVRESIGEKSKLKELTKKLIQEGVLDEKAESVNIVIFAGKVKVNGKKLSKKEAQIVFDVFPKNKFGRLTRIEIDSKMTKIKEQLP
jgi:beta-lactamase regulating signal transducer with metallopeptidase domain